MRKLFGTSLALVMCLLLSGCGTVSSMQSSKGKSFKFDTTKKFDTVIVEKFTDKVAITDASASEIKFTCESFAEMIRSKIEDKGVFKAVLKEGTPTEKTLVIRGELIKLVNGNGALRAMIGFGAGSSYLDAVVNFYDGSTNELIGVINVNKNSWVLGGALASAQDPRSYMNEASNKIACEVKKLSE